MSSPYTSQSASGYNSSPPADDGSAVASNQVLWSTIKTKLADPAKNLADNINSAISTAIGKMPGGASTSTQSTSYQVLSSDQGKLIIATASGITVTTPDATSVGSPFQFRILNNSSDTITIDGSGSQTIDGSANITVAAGAGVTLDTDGSNWYTNGTQGTLVGKQLQYGDIINGTITESNGSNAVTFSVKTLAGSDPSSSDPVIFCFRNATQGTGNYVYRTLTSALSLTISSGSTLGATSSLAFKVAIVVFDDGGTLRLGAINPGNGKIINPGTPPIASSTAEGGAGAADSLATFYTGTAVTSKAILLLAVCSYDSGLATAGSWNASPTSIQLFGSGQLPPGAVNGMTRISSATASSSASLTFTGIDSTCREYVFEWENIIPATTNTDFYIRISTDGGSTYKATSYLGVIHTASSDASDAAQAATSAIALGVSFSSSANGGGSGSARLFKPSSGGRAWITFHGIHLVNGDTTVRSSTGGGAWNSAGAVNAVQFLMSSGNITSGKVTMYGMMDS